MNNLPRHMQSSNQTELSQINEQLKNQLWTTSLINDLNSVLFTCRNPAEIVEKILLGISEVIGFSRSIFFEIDSEDFSLRPSRTMGFSREAVRNLKIPLGFEGGDISDSVWLCKHIVVDEPDEHSDPFFDLLQSQSYMVVPFIKKRQEYSEDTAQIDCKLPHSHTHYCNREKSDTAERGMLLDDEQKKKCLSCGCFTCIGVFWMDKIGSERAISSNEVTMVSTVLNTASIILENFSILDKLHNSNKSLQQTNEELKRVNHDLNIAQSKITADLEQARTIQFSLLPQSLSSSAEVAIGARYKPADAVGGDYYDVFHIDDHQLALLVADVSGHGISSALIMAMVKVLLKSYSAVDHNPKTILEKINSIFIHEIQTTHFVTIFCAILDTKNHTLRYNSAGHCPILFIDKIDKKASQIKADGLFLGPFEDMMLQQNSLSYTPGQNRLLLFTDGLTEIKNELDEMFELNRVEQIALESLDESPDMALNKIFEKQQQFAGTNTMPEDDITALIVDF